MRLQAALALGLILLVAPFASAGESRASAKFAYLDAGFMGSLTITSSPGDKFIVRAQGPDGSYFVSAGGQIPDSGCLMLATAAIGPHNDGLPQFIIDIHSPLGGVSSVFPTGP